MRIQLAVLFLLLFGTIVRAQPARDGYVFSYFTDNGETGLHLAYSYDGLNWQPLNGGQPLVAPQIGNEPEHRLMRDPNIIQGPDGHFHMVWTTSWTEPAIGYAHSDDLIHWSEQRAIPVMAHESTVRNTWAPELFWDDQKEQWLIFWSSTIPGRFAETDSSGHNGLNHRIYYTTTKDFETFTPTELFYDPGFNVIDATIVRDGTRYVMFIKDETLVPTPEKNIRITTSEHAAGPYGPASAPITGDYWAEGPTAVQIGDTWFVYFDKYRDHRYGVVTSKDLKTWSDRSDALHFIEGARHGSVLPVPGHILSTLLALEP